MSGRLGRTVDQQFLEQLLARTQSRFANLDIAIRIALAADRDYGHAPHGRFKSFVIDFSLFSNAPTFPEITLLHIRSEEHTSELQSLMRISYAVFCLKKKKKTQK